MNTSLIIPANDNGNGRIAKLFRSLRDEQETLAVLRTLTPADVVAAYHYYGDEFLTIRFFAEAHGLSVAYTTFLIETGRRLSQNGPHVLSEQDALRLTGRDESFPAYHLW